MRELILGLACCLFGCTDKDVDLGMINQSDPPAVKSLKIPTTDEGVPTVGLHRTTTGKLHKEAPPAMNTWVLVNPLSNPETRNTWWVQQATECRDGEFRGSCQFGEGSQGEGEYFAVVAITTDQELQVGQRMEGLPSGRWYSKLCIVKRAP